MNTKIFVLILALTGLLNQGATTAQERYKSITSGNVWFDQNNQQVNVHGNLFFGDMPKYHIRW